MNKTNKESVKYQIIKCKQKHPFWIASRVAKEIGCSKTYVQTILYNHPISLDEMIFMLRQKQPYPLNRIFARMKGKALRQLLMMDMITIDKEGIRLTDNPMLCALDGFYEDKTKEIESDKHWQKIKVKVE